MSSNQESSPQPSLLSSQSAVPPLQSPSYAQDLHALWNTALEEYSCSVEVNLRDRTNTFICNLDQCSVKDEDDILDVLQNAYGRLSSRRRGGKASRALRKALKPVVRGLGVILEASAETASSAGVPGGKTIFVAVAVLLQAANRVSAAFDNLEKLFERLRVYVERMQVRLRAPMRQESARIAVKALVEVLKALELATKMVRRGRLRQFLHALFSKSDDVETALEKLEDVTTEEEKMTITELAIGMHGMAYQVQETSTALSSLVESLDGVRPVLEQTEVSIQTLLHHTKEDNARHDDILVMLQTLLDRTSASDRMSLISHACTQQPEKVPTSVDVEDQNGSPVGPTMDWPYSSGHFRSVISGFSPGDRDLICRGLTILFRLTVEVVSGGTDLTLQIQAVTHLAQVVHMFIPAACTFMLLFIFWKQIFVRRPMSPSPESILIVDVLGEVFVLEPETFATWESTHSFLLRAFEGRLGISYVRRGDYGLGDSEHLLIESGVWSRVVKPGAKLKMSIIVREHIPQCPYCRTAPTGSEYVTGDGFLICTQCERRYGTYQGTAALITETPTQELRNHSESEAMSSSCDTLGDVAVPVPSREHVGWSSFSWHSDHHCLHGGQKESTASGFYTANVSLNVFERVIVEIGGSPVTIPNIIGKRSWAIIVGIDHYSDGLSLGGCVNDAKLVVDYLVNSLYVPQSHILVLASPHDEYLRTTAGHCSLPTREAILDALYTHFRDNGDVRYGDNLLFHFSGFGSSYEGEPAFGPSLIEALCPMDRNPSSFEPTYDISDRELNMIFSEIRDSRGPNLTVVLDCSHSAGSTRSVLHGVRVALPLALQNAARCMFESAANDSRRHPNTTSPLSSTWKGDMTSHVLLAACQSYETAKEITVPQGKQLTLGAFTFALISALTSPRGVDPALTYVDLTKSVIQRPVCQTPVVAGKRKRSRLWFQKGSVPKRTVAIRGTVGASGGQE